MQALICVSLVLFSIETLPDLKSSTRAWLRCAEIFVVVVFTIEYIARFYLGGIRFAASFLGIIDLMAIMPFYLSLGFDLRAIRAFRLMRLVRVLKLARYNRAIARFHRAFVIAREEFILFGFVAMILLYLAAVGIHHFEHDAQPEAFASVFHSLWWAVATLTTVGYGDVYPITPGGKVFTTLLLVIGLGIVSVPAGLIASALGKAREIEE
ncbi:ion transporter [Planctomycetes bacterium TBK1r]|uniref:Cyclic nucleotide-gated potassium channel n=1 Tax=Stieleria magnilauensis TaxID=2527963 RepID=A0ABX5XWF0_9BACT|nr:Cyclic nucleotide-gated potassium channel [Planctomycetes bacterium TBK1r]